MRFDSKFTTYEQLKQLDELPNPIKFITIRRRGKRIVEELNALPQLKQLGKLSEWQLLMVVIEPSRYMNKPSL